MRKKKYGNTKRKRREKIRRIKELVKRNTVET